MFSKEKLRNLLAASSSTYRKPIFNGMSHLLPKSWRDEKESIFFDPHQPEMEKRMRKRYLSRARRRQA